MWEQVVKTNATANMLLVTERGSRKEQARGTGIGYTQAAVFHFICTSGEGHE